MTNRTGIIVAPDLAQEMIEGVNAFSPEPDLDTSAAEEMRAVYIQEGIRIGSGPVADDPSVAELLDKLGARLAFERSGVRLYECLIQKRRAIEGNARPSVADLEHIRNEEFRHFQMLEQCILDLGGDPTAVTPAADIEAVMTSGLLKVVADPRTTVDQCLQVILAAELIDNDSWGVLVKLAQEEGLDEDVEDFETAVVQEQEHLQKVRGWVLGS
jgi:ferritin-like protein